MFKLTIAFALLGCALAGTILPNYNDDAGRIVGGEATTIEKFPYQVALEENGILVCGGSIYSNDIILTSAGCLERYKAEQIKVRLGSTNVESGGEVIQVKAIKLHEGYNSEKMINDVAIVKLASPVRFTNKMRPIELAKTVPKTGTDAFITGWGTNKFLYGSIQDVLLEAEVEIVSMNDCRSSSDYTHGRKIFDTMVCAGAIDGGKGPCYGDVGGPLVADGKLVGIGSWGSGCGLVGFPAVYASVPELRSWIIENAAKM